jgi:glycosyltransferase involved in cell wall biosynthesis
MIVGIDIRMIGSRHGGIGRYIEQLVAQLLKQSSGFSFVLFYRPADIELVKNFSSFANVKLVEADFRHYSISEQLFFWRLLERTPVDLMHFPNFNVPILYKKPFVVTIHDAVHHKISGAKKSRWLQFLAYKKTIEHAAKFSQKVITVSEYSKRDLVKYFDLPADKVVVTYEAGSLSPAVDDRLVAETKNKLGLRRPYFLFVGVQERKKNLVNLAKGFDEFIRKYRFDFDLVIAGPQDAHYPEIKTKLLSIKNKDRLLFTGYIPEHQLAALYRGAFAFTTASLHEGFGLPGVEAMNFNLPILASNIDVFNEIYDNAAIFFNPLDPSDIAEKMHLVVRDSKFYETLAANSRLSADKYSWEETAGKTLQIYRSALS